MKKRLEVSGVLAIARVSRETLTFDELERLQGTEELELALNSRAAALMSQTELEKRGKIYSVNNLREMLSDADDDTNENVKNGLEDLLRELEEFHYFWLV